MNKSEAKKYAKRLLAGYIEEMFHSRSRDPLVYDEEFEEKLRGLRLSKADRDRVCDEMICIQDRLNDDGWQSPEDIIINGWKAAKPNGKPGSRWKKYSQWQKRQGRA